MIKGNIASHEIHPSSLSIQHSAFSIHPSAFSILLAACCLLATGMAHAVGTAGYALAFDGVDEYVSVNTNNAFKPTNALTVETWVRKDNWSVDGNEAILSCSDSGGYALYIMDGTPDTICGQVYLTSAGYQTVEYDASDLTSGWHHFAMSCDGQYTMLYVDGALCDSADAGASYNISYNLFTGLQIGAESGGSCLAGRLDEIRVWTSARTAEEIRAGMHLSLQSPFVDIGAYWRCDDGSGSLLTEASSNVYLLGALTNMEEEDWIESTIPLGDGLSFSQTVDSTGEVVCTDTDVTLNFTAKTDSTDIVVTRLEGEPVSPPAGPVMGQEYWVIQAYGGTFTVNLTLSGQDEVSDADMRDPGRVKLWRRDGTSDGGWELLATAAEVDTANATVTFAGLTGFSQLVLTHSPPASLDFDGSDDFINCGSSTDFALTGDMTLTAWIKPREAASIRAIIGRKQGGSTGAGYAFHINSWNTQGQADARLKVETQSANYATTAAAVTWDVWQHVAFIANSGVCKFYVNGIEQPSGGTWNPTDGGNNLAIGAFSGTGSSPYKGEMDEVTIWNRALTVQELREMMHVQLTGSEAGLIGYWTFDSGWGGSTAFDSSGNGHDGILTNMDIETDWTESTAAVAEGVSHTETVTATGNVTFTGTSFAMDFTAKTGSNTFVVSHLLKAPNLRPEGVPAGEEYWVVHAFDSGTFTANLTVSGLDRLTAEDDADPTQVVLHRRDSMADGAWTELVSAAGVDSGADTATFNGLTAFSQLVLTRNGPDDFAGDCLDFDGVEEYVQADEVSDAMAATSALTMEAWVYPRGPGSGQDAIMGFHNSSGGNLNLLFLRIDGSFAYYDGDVDYVGTTEVFPMNRWYHVAVTIDSDGNGVLYVNGEALQTFTTTVRPMAGGHFSIGQEWDASTATDHFNGLIDEVIVWNVARTAEQIRESMNETLVGSESGLVAYWQFNDGAGSTTLADRSGNGYDGTLVNMESDEDWTASSIIIGESQSREVTETGLVTFSDADITFDFTAKSGSNTFVVTHVSGSPEPLPPGGALDNEYWMIRVYGTGTYTCDVLVGGQDQLVEADAEAPWGIKFRHRDAGSDGAWTPFSTATAVDSSTGTVTFTNLSDPALDGQFTLTRDAERTALEFDGIDDYVSAGSGIDLGNASFTFEFWARRDSTGTWDMVAGMGNATNDNELMIGFRDDDRFTFGFFGDDLDSAEVYTDSAWHHWACVYNAGSNLRSIYRDGALVDSDTASQDLGDAGQEFFIGRRGYSESYWFHGGLDELRLWNTARSETEIRETMHLPLEGDESGLLAYWPCDDGAGTTLADRSGNGHDGTLTHMDSTDAWTDTTPVFGTGVSETQTIAAVDTFDFSTVGLGFDVTSSTGTSEVVVTHLYQAPNLLPTGTPADDESWIVHGYGDGTFTADLTVRDQWRFTAGDQSDPTRVRLRRRDVGPDAIWAPLADAASVDTATGSTVFEQIPVADAQLAVVHDAPNRALSLSQFPVENAYAMADGICAGVAGGTLTLQAWVRPDADGDGTQDAILSFHTAAKDDLIIVAFRPDDGRFSYWDTDCSDVQLSADTFAKDQWHHIAVTIDGNGNVCMYVNGTLQVSGLATTVRPAADGCFSIGQEWDGSSASDFFKGIVDEVAVWNVVRAQAEIRSAMHLSFSGREDGLVGYWRFDDGSGQTAADSSRSGIEAELTGLYSWTSSTPAIGFGVSATRTVSTNGFVTFDDTGLDMDVTGKAGVTTFVVSCLQTSPVEEPLGYEDDRYWVVSDYDGGTFSADFLVNAEGEVTATDEKRPWRGKLYRRDTGSDGDWTLQAVASSADVATQTFTVEGITSSGQFALSHYEPERVPGTTLDFDGTDDYVTVPHSLSLIPTTELTVEAWVKLDDATDQQTIVNKLDVGTSGFALSVSSDKLSARIRDMTSYYSISGGTVPDKEWTHIAVTWKTGGRMIGYVNGVEVANVAASETYPIYSSTEPLHIGVGESEGSYQTRGQIDEVRVWTVVRTVQEIRETMHVTPTGLETGLVGYWQFNEGEGTTTADTSGYRNTGTLTNMDANTDWVESTVAVGGGNAATLSCYTPGTLVFDTTELTMNVTSQQDESTFVVSHILLAPNPAPDGTGAADEYWIVRDYGTGTSVYDLILEGQDGLTGDEASTPTRVRLHHRGANDDGSWSAIAFADAVDATADSATFTGLSGTGQYVLTHDDVRLGPGTALDFDGTDDCVEVADQDTLDFSETDCYTLECWFMAHTLGGLHGLVDKYQTASAGGYLVRLNGTELSFDARDTSGLGLEADRWYHVAAVNDGGTRHLYVNGTEVTLTGTGHTVQANTNPLRLGVDYSTRFFDGRIDEVRIWGTARTARQVREHMYHPLTGSETGLVAYWSCDDGAGTMLADLSGNGHDGVLTNMDPETDWVQSATPIATGISSTIVTEGVSGDPVTLAFPGTNVSLRLTSDTVAATPIVVSRLLGAPNTVPSGTLLGNGYWLLRAYDDGAGTPDFSGTLRFHNQGQLTTDDLASPQRVCIHRRTANSTGSWSRGGAASWIDGATVLFSDRDESDDGQLILTHDTPTAGNALDFDGTDDYLEIPHAAALKPTSELTVEVWACVDDDWAADHENEHILGCTEDGGWNLAITSTAISAAVRANSAYSTASYALARLAAGWHHFAFTSNGEVTKLYVDGVLRNTVTLSGWYDIEYAYNNSILLGAEVGSGTTPSGNYFRGRLDEFRLWSVVRSEQDICAGMDRELSGAETGLELYYRFDQGTPGGDNVGETTCVDQTANGYDGNLSNFALTGDSSNWVASYALVRADVDPSPATSTNSFTITWSGSDYGPEPTSYLIDVATDPEFTSMVSGYDGLDVGDATSCLVSGLDEYTTYYYRVRSENDTYGEGQATTGYATPAPRTARWCLYLDGEDDYVQVRRPSGYVGLETFSLTCWFKQEDGGATAGTGSVTGYPLITKGCDQGDGSTVDVNYFLGVNASGKLVGDFEDKNGGVNHPITGTTAITKETWYFAALVHDPTVTDQELKLYLYKEDGTGGLESTVDTDGATPRNDSLHDVGIGTAFKTTGDTSGRFAGDMAEVAIWSKALSADELVGVHHYRYERWVQGNDYLNRYLPLHDAYGDRAVDYRHSRWGLIHGNPVWRQTDLDLLPAGPHGWAIGLNGTDSFYSIGMGDASVASIPRYGILRSFTVEFWARRDSETDDDTVFSEGDGSDGGGADGTADEIVIGFRADKSFQFGFFYSDEDDDVLLADLSYSDTNWHHWAVSFDADTMARRIYRDGVLVAQDQAAAYFDAANDQYIGKSMVIPDDEFHGTVDELRIWHTSRSLDEIRENRCRSLRGSETGLALCLRFDEWMGGDEADHGAFVEAVSGTTVGAGSALELLEQPIAFSPAAPREQCLEFGLDPGWNGQTPGARLGPQFDVASRSLTFECWAQRHDLTSDVAGTLFYHGTSADACFVARFLSASEDNALNIEYNYDDDGDHEEITLPESLIDDDWHHWAIVIVDGDETGENALLRVYRDGGLVYENALGFSHYQVFGEMIVGNQIDGDSTGVLRVDEFRVWSTARTQAEIAETMSSELSGNETALEGYYTFNECNGYHLFDSSVHHRHGCLYHASLPSRVDHSFPSGYEYLIDRNQSLANPRALRLAGSETFDDAGDFTWEAWIRPVASSDWQNIISRYDHVAGWTTGASTLMVDENGYLEFSKKGQDTIPPEGSEIALTLNQWQHVALRVEADTDGSNDTVTLFVNGTPRYSTNALDVGASLPPHLYTAIGSTFHGHLDEILIWSIARTDQEVLHSYRRLSNGGTTGLEAYIDFDDVGDPVVSDRTLKGHRAWISGDVVYTLDPDQVPDLFPALPGEWAASFDGSNDYAVIPADPVFDDNEFSVEFWVKQDETGESDAMLDKGAPSTDFYFATQNGTQITAEPEGGCVNFSSGYLSLTSLPDIFDGTTMGDFTVELWVKPDLADSEGTVFEITKSTGGEGNFVRLIARQNWTYLYLIVGDDSTAGGWDDRDRIGSESGFCTEADTWYHLAATFDADASENRLRLYINGIEQNGYSGSYGPTASEQAAFFSQAGHSSSSTSRLKGMMDEIRIWNVPRTQAEIAAGMHRVLTSVEIATLPSLLHYYKLNEALSGPFQETALDSAGTNPGTLNGNLQRLTSSVPAATAVADTQTEAAGLVQFSTADLMLNYSEQSGAAVTAAKITSHPSSFPDGCRPFDAQYWILHRNCDSADYWFKAGEGSPYTADFTFTLAEDLSSADSLNPQLIALYRRNHTSDGEWSRIADAVVVDAVTDTVTFENVSVALGQGGLTIVNGSSQFLVGRRAGQGVVFGMGLGAALGSCELSHVWGDDAWHHVCGTYDGTTMRLYADGDLVGSALVSATMTDNEIRIGSYRDGTGFFSGMLDELRFWDYALSADDIGFYANKELRGDEDGLLGYWKFREGGGITAADSTGNGHDATLYNGLARVAHDNDYVSLPAGDYSLSLDNDTLVYVGGLTGIDATLTVEAWVCKSQATSNAAVFSLGNGALTVYAGRSGNECMAYYDANNGWKQSTTEVPVGEWHHLAWVIQEGPGGYINFYLDGELGYQTALSSALPDLTGDTFIGSGDMGADPFLGELTEIRLWSTVRGQGDIRSYMEKRLGGNEDGLVGYWPCTDGSGQLVSDLSANGYDAVFYYAYDLNWSQPEGLVFESAPAAPGALSFDGNDTSVSLPYTNRGEAFTVAAWINLDAAHDDDAADDVIVGWGGSSGHFAELRITTESKLLYCEFDGDWQPLVASNLIPTNEWTHVAFTKTGTTVTLFINGVARATGTIDQSLVLDSLAIGSAAGDSSLRPFYGLIDEVQFWDVALTTVVGDELWGDEDHLVRYYKFDEGDGATAIDYTGSGFYNGRLSSGLDTDHRVSQDDLPMVTLEDRQNALEFDGVDDYLSVTHFDRPDPMMLSVWIKPGAVSSIHTIVCWSDSADPESGHRIAFRLNDGHLEYGENSGAWTAVTSTGTIPKNTWTHAAVVKNGETVTLYIDGAADGSGTIAGTPVTDTFTVGMQPGDPTPKHFYKGLVEELQIWNLAPEAADLASERFNTRRGNETGLVLYYNFNQPTGLTIEDQTANGYAADMENIEFSNLHRIEISDSELDLDNPPAGEYVLRLDGVDDYATIDGLAPTAYTVSVWFRPVVDIPDVDVTLLSGPNFGLILHPDNSVSHWWTTVAGTGSQTLDGAVVRGEWQCVVAVNDGLTARLYHGEDGIADFATDVAADSAFTGGCQTANAGTIYVGDDPGDEGDAPFEGLIDELAIWSVALPEKDIEALWEHELQGSENGLLAFYNFNGGDPDAAADSAGEAQNAVLVNMVLTSREDREPGFVLSEDGVARGDTWDAADSAPVALQFDGDDAYAVIPRTALIMADTDFSFEFWLRAKSWTGQVPVVTNARSDSTDAAWGFFLDDDEEHWTFKLLGDITLTGGAVNDNAWHHLCVVYDATAGQIYAYHDGVQIDDDVPGDIAGADNADDIAVGSYVNRTVYLAGFLDEMRRWDVALSATEVGDRFNHYQRASLADLGGYWRIHETSTTEVADLSGGNPMVLHNVLAANLVVGADFAPPSPGELAVELDGTDDFIQIPNDAGYLGLQTFTIALWFKKTGTGTMAVTGGLTAVPLVAKGREEGDGSIHDVNYFFGIDESGVLAADFEDMADGANYPVKGSTAIQNDTWYHAAVTYDPTDDGQGFKLYLNGVTEGSRSTGGAVPRYDSDQDMAIGAALNSGGIRAGSFEGDIDEVRIWNTAISQTELQMGVDNRRRGGETGLIAVWQCDSGWGATLADSGRLGIDGTLTNMDTDNCWVDGKILDLPQDGDHAIAFSVAGQHVELDASHEDDFDFADNFTVEFWLYVEAWGTASQAIVSKGDSAWQIRRYEETSQIEFCTPGIQKDTDGDDEMDDAPDLVSESDIPVGEWTHVAVVYDADMHRKYLYINGTLDASLMDASGFVQTNAYPVWVGANPETAGLELNGAVDELRIWTVVRSDVRISANYNRDVRDNESGLLGRWRFNEGSGAVALDTKEGTAINGALVNLENHDRIDGVVLEEWANAQFALLLDGEDEDVSVDSLTADLTGGFTMECWIRPDVLQEENENEEVVDVNQYVFDVSTADGQTSVALRLDGSDLVFEVTDGGTVTGSLVAEGVFTPEVWAHVAVTVDAEGVVHLYVDGKEQAVSEAGSEVTIPTNTTWDGITFGSNGSADDYFTGAIDEFRLWDEARDEAEIELFHDRELFDGTSGLLGYWRLNEGVGEALFDQTDTDTAATANNIEEEDWVDGKYIVEDSVNRGDLDLTPVPDAAGLWEGRITLNKVSEVSAVSTEAQPTADEMVIDILLHVDASGQVRLLKDVTLMRTATDDEDNAEIVFVTDETKLGDFVGLVNRDGVLIGLRKSTVFYDFDGNELPLDGGLGFGHVVYGLITIPADHPTNPYRHKYHPDHKSGYRIDRSFFLVFDEEAPSGSDVEPGQGVETLSGTYQETLHGLHKRPIVIEGDFELQRVSPVAKLNNE